MKQPSIPLGDLSALARPGRRTLAVRAILGAALVGALAAAWLGAHRTGKHGGLLPSGPTTVISGQLFPQVFGDPDVKYLGGCTFVYVSLILVRR